jgi:hypothetical protein
VKARRLILLLGLVLVCLGVACYLVWPREHIEVQARKSKRSPDGKWIAVVQLENYNTAGVVNDAVYAVRLKKTTNMNGEGDLVMNVPAIYPQPEPDIEWSNGTLVVLLAAKVNYQYFASPVDGVAIAVRRDVLGAVKDRATP